ncbi:MAG: PepSY domain-containing protein [Blastocatellales bacterium]
MRTMIISKLFVIAFLLASVSVIFASSLTPTDGKALSEIIKSVEDRNLGTIVEAELEDGYWEVKVKKPDSTVQLYFDPKTGKEEGQRPSEPPIGIPPPDGKPLSSLIKKLEDARAGMIVEIEFDDGFWEVNAIRNGQMRELLVNPKTGEFTEAPHPDSD